VDEFVEAVQEVFPKCCIHFEDWTGVDAVHLLQRYRDKYCVYNDDVQGTAVITLAGMINPVKLKGTKLKDEKYLFLGAGSAGIGLADLLCAALAAQGISLKDAQSRVRGRDRGWSSVQVACLLRLLSDHRRTHPMTDTARPSTNSWFGIRLLPGVLSLTAGSMDVIGFLGLGGLFTAHITGNLVIFAAHVVTGEAAQWAAILSVPVFMLVLCLARLSAGGFETIGHDSLRPLLLLQFLFLSGALIICVAAGPDIDPNAPIATVAGMLAVSAMAVQNALVQVSLHGVPATAVITTNIARFTTDVGTILLGARRDEVARERADRLWPSIAGFIIGCCVGAVCEARFGLRALALPAGLALLALATAAKSNALMVQKSGGAEPGHRASPLRRPRKIMIGRL
jgi:uncharacterized membrane protein YoaK (UPF0700 family)